MSNIPPEDRSIVELIKQAKKLREIVNDMSETQAQFHLGKSYDSLIVQFERNIAYLDTLAQAKVGLSPDDSEEDPVHGSAE